MILDNQDKGGAGAGAGAAGGGGGGGPCLHRREYILAKRYFVLKENSHPAPKPYGRLAHPTSIWLV